MFSTNSEPVVFAVIVLLALSQVGTCLECYSCSFIRNKCKDPFVPDDTILTITCPPTVNACFKSDWGEGRKSRGCDDYDYCTDKVNGCYACQTDLCNSSSSIMPSFVVTIFVAAITAKYFM